MNPIRPVTDKTELDQASQFLKNILNVGNGVQTNSKELTDEPFKNMSSMSEDMTSDISSSYGPAGVKMVHQEISFVGAQNEEETFKIDASDVTIITSREQHSSSSNRVKIQNIVNYGWEHKYHLGRLVAVHSSGQYVAFALTAFKTGGGLVRVSHTKCDQRVLIKGMKGQVKDLAFAQCRSSVVLACVDEYGTLLVNEISLQEDNILQCTLMLRIDPVDMSSGDRHVVASDHHHLFWCHYIPECSDEIEQDPEDLSELLAVTHDNMAEVFNAIAISKKYGPGPILSKDIPSGIMWLKGHAQPIIAASFSPDGTAVSTASLDGQVMFFQVNLQDKNQKPIGRCLHRWHPHGGTPVSCLFFLDNYKTPNPEIQLWKFALTGTDFNRELKIWCCQSWNCLQTLRFNPSTKDAPLSCMKVEMDPSAGFFVLSDISNNVVYALQIYQDASLGQARVCSVAQFPMTLPVLSLALVDATFCKIKPLTGEALESMDKNDHERNGETEMQDGDDKSKGVYMKLWWINTKSLQKSYITYHSPVILTPVAEDTVSIHSQDSIVFRDRLSDISQDLQVDTEPINKPFMDMELAIQRDSTSTPIHNNNNSSIHATSGAFHNSFRSNSSGAGAGEVLLTPDDFASPSSPSATTLQQTTKSSDTPEELPYKSPSLSKPITPADLKLISFPSEPEPPLATSEVTGTVPVRRKSSQVSSTSSPSQEVADILSPIKSQGMAEGRSSSSPKLLNSPPVSTSNYLPPMTNHLSQNVLEIRKSPTSSWPPLPDFKDYKMSTSLPSDIVNHVPLSYVSHGSPPVCPVKYVPDDDNKIMLQKVQDSVTSLNQTMAGLSGIISEQTSELKRLRDTVFRLQNERLKDEQLQTQGQLDLMQRIEQLDTTLPAKLEKANTQQVLATQKKLESLFTKQWETERKLLEKQAADISQAAMLASTSKLAEHVHIQIKTFVTSEVSKFLDSFRQQIQQEQNQRLASSEVALKDSLSKLVKTKVFVDSLSSSVATSLQPQVQQTCKEVLNSNLLPTVEKLCRNLFLQLNEVFKNGTKDYLSQAERFVESSCAKHAQLQTVQMQRELKEQATTISNNQQQQLTHLRSSLEKSMTGSLQNFGDGLVEQLRSLVSEEVQGALDAADQRGLFTSPPSAMVNSRVVTPSPKIDPIFQKKQILSHLEAGHYNEAFQMALRAADISVVNMTIEQVSPSKLFGDANSLLKLPVLLSLINQLGNSLDNNTELKLQYLEFALMKIGPSDATSREMQLQVLRPLKEKLLTLSKHNPSAYTSKIWMLKMCVESLIHGAE